MTAPALKVEVAFDSGWSTPAASRTWTDVTTYVLGGAGVTHGRQDEFSTTNPNTLQLTLDNSDGRFTAGLATSPYYPNVKLARPVRVTVTPAGQSPVVRFVGYVDQWPVEWPGVVGSFATCALTASSRMALLGIGTELKSIIEEEILADGPIAYYTHGEAEGATQANDSSGEQAPPLLTAGSGAAVVFGDATGPPTDDLTAATFPDNGKVLRAVGGTVMPPTLTAFTVEAFVLVEASQGGTAIAVLPPGELEAGSTGERPGYGYFELRATSSGEPVVEFTDTSGANDLIFDAASIAGDTTHLAATFTNSGDMELFVNGVSEGTAVVGTWPSRAQDFVVGFNNGPGTGLVVSHVAVFDSVLSDAQLLSHSDAGLTGFAGDVAVLRLLRYAGYAGIPALECDFETGVVSDLAHIDTTGKTPLACMREVETTEGGVLFDAPDGTLTFHGRTHRYAAASVLTVDVSAGELGPSYAPKMDTFGLLNDVTAVTTDGAVTARVKDQDSIDDVGNYRQSVELATTDPDEPFMRASWLTGSYAEPSTRVATLTVELTKLTGARQAAVLAVGVGDRITVTNLMDQSDASTKEFYVEGYAEQIGGVGGVHQVVFNLSPAEISDVWQLDSSTYSVLGSTTRLAY